MRRKVCVYVLDCEYCKDCEQDCHYSLAAPLLLPWIIAREAKPRANHRRRVGIRMNDFDTFVLGFLVIVHVSFKYVWFIRTKNGRRNWGEVVPKLGGIHYRKRGRQRRSYLNGDAFEIRGQDEILFCQKIPFPSRPRSVFSGKPSFMNSCGSSPGPQMLNNCPTLM